MERKHFNCIGMVHLLPLPGSPRHDKEGGIQAVIDRAQTDCLALVNAGFDGIIVENFGDVPFFPGPVPPETVAAMTRVACEVLARASPREGTSSRLPMGINVLRNDAMAAIAIAKAVGAGFIRVNVHAGTVFADQGMISGRAHDTMRYKRAIDAGEVALWADVSVKHASPLVPRDPVQECGELVTRALADVLVFTGDATGSLIPVETLEAMKRVKQKLPNVPLYLGSGVSAENITSLLEACNYVASGCIVGSSLKEGGLVKNPVDEERARLFVASTRYAGGRA